MGRGSDRRLFKVDDIAAAPSSRDTAILIAEYENGVSLYQFYIRILIQGNLFALSIVGALISYVLTNYGGDPKLTAASLFVPVGISVMVLLILGRALFSATNFEKNMRLLGDEIGLRIRPSMRLLRQLLLACILLHVLVLGTAAFLRSYLPTVEQNAPATNGASITQPQVASFASMRNSGEIRRTSGLA